MFLIGSPHCELVVATPQEEPVSSHVPALPAFPALGLLLGLCLAWPVGHWSTYVDICPLRETHLCSSEQSLCSHSWPPSSTKQELKNVLDGTVIELGFYLSQFDVGGRFSAYAKEILDWPKIVDTSW